MWIDPTLIFATVKEVPKKDFGDYIGSEAQRLDAIRQMERIDRLPLSLKRIVWEGELYASSDQICTCFERTNEATTLEWLSRVPRYSLGEVGAVPQHGGTLRRLHRMPPMPTQPLRAVNGKLVRAEFTLDDI